VRGSRPHLPTGDEKKKKAQVFIKDASKLHLRAGDPLGDPLQGVLKKKKCKQYEKCSVGLRTTSTQGFAQISFFRDRDEWRTEELLN